MKITYRGTKGFTVNQLVKLYSAVGWSSAIKPDYLHSALANSHSLIFAWYKGQLVGIGDSLSDGFLVVYYPHLLVHPDFPRNGVGGEIVCKLLKKHADFHQQILIADGNAIEFYRTLGFIRAGKTEFIWVYEGTEHEPTL